MTASTRKQATKVAVKQENTGVFGHVRVTERIEGEDGKGMFVTWTGAHGQPFLTIKRKVSGSEFSIALSKSHNIFADPETLAEACDAYAWAIAHYKPASATPKASGKAGNVAIDSAAIAQAVQEGVTSTIAALIASGQLVAANPAAAPVAAAPKQTRARKVRA